nr:hypothetical protein [Tanacetum cinerariifolium]
VVPKTPDDQSDSSGSSHPGSDNEEGFLQTDDEELKDKSDDERIETYNSDDAGKEKIAKDQELVHEKPLPLQGPPSHKTILVDFFFNKDLEYLKTENKEKKYAISLTKPKPARYEQGLEQMIPNLWSSSKVKYDLNAALRIHH